MYITKDTKTIDSEFGIDPIDGLFSIIIESSGGANANTNRPRRNPDYNKLMAELLLRAKKSGAIIVGVYLESSRVKEIALSDRKVYLRETKYPISLDKIDLEILRTRIGFGVSKSFQSDRASTGGSAQKRIRVIFDRFFDIQTNTESQNNVDIPDQVTERETLIQSRVGQGQFRSQLFMKFKSRCCMSGIENPELLCASHIKPWSICLNSERLDLNNGLLLSPNFDKLFDRGLITIQNGDSIVVSNRISGADAKVLRVPSKLLIQLNEKQQGYMLYHNKYVFNERKPNQTHESSEL